MSNKENATRKRLRSSSISAVISIALVLFMVGIVGVLVLSARSLSEFVKEHIGFSIYIEDGTSETEASYLRKVLDASQYVKSTHYYSKDDAARLMEQDLGPDFIEYLGYNPLSAFIDVRLNAQYANNDSIAKIEQWLGGFAQVKEVDYQKSLVSLVDQNVHRISMLVLGVAALMMFLSLVLINNTIRLLVYSRRFIINTMKLVGAQWSFIRRPFVLRGALHGLFASLLAMALLTALFYGISVEIADITQIVRPLHIGAVFVLMALMGICINTASTSLSVNRYLRLNSGDLYY
ncbi:MAG: permease-like cell division protein FtsX [Bacteroidales bacterium]|nr:permease-like cell division protein FtsX [Bacteroidales bacterium]